MRIGRDWIPRFFRAGWRLPAKFVWSLCATFGRRLRATFGRRPRARSGWRPRLGPEWSLRLRLSLFFAALLFAAWSVAAVCSWRAGTEHINTFFDTQQMLFAKRLAAAGYASLTDHLPDTDALVAASGDEGEQEDDALAFAVFRPDGVLILSDGEEGRKFRFNPGASGFVNTKIKGDTWRIVWLPSLDGRVVVAVGQELEYRDDMAFEMLAGQMLPWLCLLPALLLGLTLMLGRELAPLRSVAADLARRDPDDATPVAVTVQSEVRPLVLALNGLFARMDGMLHRERDFIANAAHELRTPLAGLSIQAQVARAARKPETRDHALEQLRKGIDRASRLVDQLLMLFKLESLDGPRGSRFRRGTGQGIGRGGEDGGEGGSGAASRVAPGLEGRSGCLWETLLRTALEEVCERAEARGLRLDFSNEAGPEAAVTGQPELLAVMLRNLLGNAASYAPEGGIVSVRLDRKELVIRNTCPPMAPEDAARLGERFFRPPGQRESGSGLGLSIARRIAELHGLSLRVSAETGWFTVAVSL